jgi:hypothetical protein
VTTDEQGALDLFEGVGIKKLFRVIFRRFRLFGAIFGGKVDEAKLSDVVPLDVGCLADDPPVQTRGRRRCRRRIVRGRHEVVTAAAVVFKKALSAPRARFLPGKRAGTSSSTGATTALRGVVGALKEGRREGGKEGKKEGEKESGKEGRKERRKEGKKEGRKERC